MRLKVLPLILCLAVALLAREARACAPPTFPVPPEIARIEKDGAATTADQADLEAYKSDRARYFELFNDVYPCPLNTNTPPRLSDDEREKLKPQLSAIEAKWFPHVGADQAGDLKVEITPGEGKGASLQQFFIHTKLINTGLAEKTLHIWSCSYADQWQADVPFVHMEALTCKKNGLSDINLQPGGAYERDIVVNVNTPAGELTPDTTKFRLGFTDGAEKQQTPPPAPVWSNPMIETLHAKF